MLKEIYEQPEAVRETIGDRVSAGTPKPPPVPRALASPSWRSETCGAS